MLTLRLKVGNVHIGAESVRMTGGGDVVGNIPKGLPAINIPQFKFGTALGLLPVAIIISLLGFMEAISIAKAMVAKTGQKLDPNQELMGQGLANIIGSFSQSYAVSGSFSRSAVNIQAGAISGLSNVFSSCVVVITLLFFTYSTMISWSYYGDRCALFLFGLGAVMPCRLVFLVFIVIGAVTKLDIVWNMADITNALMAFPNLVGLLAMSGYMAMKKKDYFSRPQHQYRPVEKDIRV